MRAELSKLHHQLQTTFIYVTHDQTEAMTMATRIAVINHGVLQQIDTPQNLYDTPANKFVAGFIGSPAMNFFDAKIVKKVETSLLTVILSRLKFQKTKKHSMMDLLVKKLFLEFALKIFTILNMFPLTSHQNLLHQKLV